MKFKRHEELAKGRIDLAPLVDVVFLLIIFFMLTSSFVRLPGITVKLPKAVTSEALEERNVIITITSDGEIFFNEEAITLEELAPELVEAAKTERPILIKADQKSSLGSVVGVWDLCRKSGISKVSIATKP